MKETAFLQIPLWAFNHLHIQNCQSKCWKHYGLDKAVINVSYKNILLIWILRENNGTDIFKDISVQVAYS